MLGYLDGWLNQQIIQEPFVAYDQNGDKTYGIPVMLACRTEVGIKKITNKEGQEVISTGTTYLTLQPRWATMTDSLCLTVHSPG